MGMAPSVSIVIPVHGGALGFDHCLAAVRGLSPPADEVLVVVDGPADEPARLAEESGAQVLSMPTNGGPARARNMAARAADGDVLFFVDADVVVRPDAIERIRRLFADDSDLDAVIGSYDDAPGQTNFLSQYRNLLNHYVHQVGNERASTFWGACGAIKRGVFLRHGGLDETYARPSIEDIELGYRLRSAGCRIMLCKDLQCRHMKRWTFGTMVRTDFFDRAVPWARLIAAKGGMVNDLNLRWGCRLSVLAVFGLVVGLAGGALWPWLWVIAAGCSVVLVGLNFRFYRFLARKRGILFALAAAPLHWLHYLESGVAFPIGVLTCPARARVSPTTSPAAPMPDITACRRLTEDGTDGS